MRARPRRGPAVRGRAWPCLRFVEIVTRHAYRTTDEDVEDLATARLDRPADRRGVYITALFAFFNRVADAFGLEDPNYFEAAPPGLTESHAPTEHTKPTEPRPPEPST